MQSTPKTYPNSGASARSKTGQARNFFEPLSLQRDISAAMVRIHRISPELADYHVAAMDLSELIRRFRLYAGAELSAAGPNPRAVSVSSTRFSRPQRRRQADSTQLRSRGRGLVRSRLPESVKKEPGPVAGALFAPAAAQVGRKKPGISEMATAVSGEGF